MTRPAATVLIGGRGYPLDERGAEFLGEWLDSAYPDTEDATDDEGDAALALLRAIRLSVAADDDPGPIEPSNLQIEILAGVLHDQLVKGSPGLSALTQAVRRFRGDPEFRSLQ